MPFQRQGHGLQPENPGNSTVLGQEAARPVSRRSARSGHSKPPPVSIFRRFLVFKQKRADSLLTLDPDHSSLHRAAQFFQKGGGETTPTRPRAGGSKGGGPSLLSSAGGSVWRGGSLSCYSQRTRTEKEKKNPRVSLSNGSGTESLKTIKGVLIQTVSGQSQGNLVHLRCGKCCLSPSHMVLIP